MKYAVIIEKGPMGYGARALDLPGCIVAAKTREETYRLINEAIRLHLEALIEKNHPVPEPQLYELVEMPIEGKLGEAVPAFDDAAQAYAAAAEAHEYVVDALKAYKAEGNELEEAWEWIAKERDRRITSFRHSDEDRIDYDVEPDDEYGREVLDNFDARLIEGEVELDIGRADRFDDVDDTGQYTRVDRAYNALVDALNAAAKTRIRVQECSAAVEASGLTVNLNAALKAIQSGETTEYPGYESNYLPF